MVIMNVFYTICIVISKINFSPTYIVRPYIFCFNTLICTTLIIKIRVLMSYYVLRDVNVCSELKKVNSTDNMHVFNTPFECIF